MAILLSIIIGLSLWVIAWAIGIKGFDALMLVILIVLGACAWHIMKPFLPGYRQDPDEPRAGGSWQSR